MAIPPNEQPAPNPSNKKLWLVIIVLLLIMVTGVAIGGTYFYMSGSTPEAEAEAQAEAAKKEPPPKPVFVAVDPFSVNLQDDRGRILYVRLSLKAHSDEDATRLTENMPQVRNRILLTLTNTDAKTLTTVDGKQALASALQQTISEPFTAEAEPVSVDNVLFTDFIVQ